MIDKNGGSGGEFPTVIGADATFKGELSFDKGVRVDGRIEGKIATKGQHRRLARRASSKADVQRRQRSWWKVPGQRATYPPTTASSCARAARLEGDIKATKLIVTEGATFNGHCKVGPNAGAGGTTPAATTGGTAPTNRVSGERASAGRASSQSALGRDYAPARATSSGVVAQPRRPSSPAGGPLPRTATARSTCPGRRDDGELPPLQPTRACIEDLKIKAYHAVVRLATAGQVEVARKGTVVAQVRVNELIVEGTVKGNVTALGRVVIGKKASIEGDIACRSLAVQPGARVSGFVRVDPEFTPAPAEIEDD